VSWGEASAGELRFVDIDVAGNDGVGIDGCCVTCGPIKGLNINGILSFFFLYVSRMSAGAGFITVMRVLKQCSSVHCIRTSSCHRWAAGPS
jgi:hypothetical protein